MTTPTSRQPPRFSNRSRRRLTAALLCGALAFLPSGVRSDDEKPNNQPYVERSSVELALVEVVVRDSRGRHVRGLTKEGFELLAGGSEVRIVSFDEIDLAAPGSRIATEIPQTPEPSEDAAPDSEMELTALSEDQLRVLQQEAARRMVDSRLGGERWFTMIFDGYNNVSPLRMGQVRRAARTWVDNQMRPRDLVAIYEINPYLSSLSGFTDDKAHLKKSINEVRVFPASPIGEEMVEQRLEQGQLLTRQAIESQLINAATFGADLLQAERDTFYMNIASVADVMRSLTGTRAILLFSGGFPITRSRATESRGGLTVRFMRMLEELESEGIRVFTFDVGEDGSYTDAEERTNIRIAADDLGFSDDFLDDLQLGIANSAANAHQEILVILGNETGGRFWRTHDYKSGLQAADDDLSHYYLIGYAPPEVDDDKIYQRLKLKYPGRNYKIQWQKGRFRTEPVVAPASITTRAEEPAPLEPEEPALPLEVTCRPLFYPTASGDTLVVLPIRVDGPLEPMQITATEAVIDFDLTLRASVAGEDVEIGQRTIRIPIKPEQHAAFENGMRMRDAMLLPPTTVDLEVQIKLNGQSRGGNWTSTVTIPRRATEGFGLTDLALLTSVDPTPLVYDVFLKQQTIFGTHPPVQLEDPVKAAAVASVQIGSGFSKGTPLLAQVQIASPPAASPETQQPLSMDWELIPDGGGAPLLPPVTYRQLQMVDGGKLLDVIVDLDLAAVEPGAYTLRLTATNLLDDSRDIRSTTIHITR